MNILVTLDRNYLPPLRVMLGSLLRNDPGETFEIYAIGDGLLPEDWAALRSSAPGRGRIHPLEVPADLFADAPGGPVLDPGHVLPAAGGGAAAAFSGPGAVSGPGHSGNQSRPGPV